MLPEDFLARLRELSGLYREPPPNATADGHPSLLLLFGGPRGMGKTSAALALAGELGLPTLEADLGELLAQDAVEATRSAARLLNHARQTGGVLVLDGADAVLRSRRLAGAGAPSQSAITPLVELDRDGERLPGIVIFCAELIHAGGGATRPHFDQTLVFPEPNAGLRERIWHRHLPQGHRIAGPDVAYVAEAFRLSGKAIASCCAMAERTAAGRPVTLGDVAAALDAEYAGRVMSDWTRAALTELRTRATATANPPAAPATKPVRRAPAQPAGRESVESVWPMAPAAAPSSRRAWRVRLVIAIAGAIAAVALGFLLSHHGKARPTAANSPAPSGPSAALVSYRTALAQTIGTLNQARTRFGPALASANTPTAQTQAATALAAADAGAASTLARLKAGSAASANQALVAALQKAGGAYGALAVAAQKHDQRAYASAQQAISSAETSVAAAVTQARAIVG